MQRIGKKTVKIQSADSIESTTPEPRPKTGQGEVSSLHPEAQAHSRPEDRTRFSKPPPKDARSATSMLLTRGRRPLASIDLSGALGPELASPLLEALGKSSGSMREEAEAALERLVKSPIAERIAISLLTGETIQNVSKGKVRFLGATQTNAEIVKALAGWGRTSEVRQGLAGVHGALTALLEPQLLAHSDPAEVRGALRWIDLQMKSAGNSTGVVARLIDAGCLPSKDWSKATRFAPGSDPIGVLARSSLAIERQVVRSDLVAAYETRFFREGLTKATHWTRTQDLVNHRGIVGEALRMAQLNDDPRFAGKRVEQGVYLLTTPSGLEVCKTVDEALAWCESHQRKSNRLTCVNVDGALVFGFRSTEIDALILDEVDGQLRCLRLENVKAGNCTSGKAKQQCETAIASLADPAIQIFFEKSDGGYEDVSARLDRRLQTLKRVELVTVGPEGDPQFDEHLPLSSGDVTTLAERLRDRLEA